MIKPGDYVKTVDNYPEFSTKLTYNLVFCSEIELGRRSIVCVIVPFAIYGPIDARFLDAYTTLNYDFIDNFRQYIGQYKCWYYAEDLVVVKKATVITPDDKEIELVIEPKIGSLVCIPDCGMYNGGKWLEVAEISEDGAMAWVEASSSDKVCNQCYRLWKDCGGRCQDMPPM